MSETVLMGISIDENQINTIKCKRLLKKIFGSIICLYFERIRLSPDLTILLTFQFIQFISINVIFCIYLKLTNL
jgi:hypothetical protein